MLQTLSYIINVAPEGVPQVVRLSQNENGRTLAFTLTGAGTVNIPSGSTVTISGTKPDGVVYSQTGTISGTTASFPETTQMTAVSGIWPAKIKVTYNGETIATCKIVMAIDPDPVAPGSVPSSSQLNGLVAEAQQYATYAKYEAFGSPLVAATAAAMTDKTRVYVYTGSEAGKTAGHWYYWNGSAWTDGGVYNSQGINTDTTLTISGMAADAKATGDQFTLVKQDFVGTALSTVRNGKLGRVHFAIGKHISSTGEIQDVPHYALSDLFNANPGDVLTFTINDSETILYVGLYNTSGTFITRTRLDIDPRNLTMPDNIGYIRFSIGKAAVTYVPTEEWITANFNVSVKSNISGGVANINALSSIDFITGRSINSEGEYITSNNYALSSFCLANPGNTLIYSPVSADCVIFIAEFDRTKEFIKRSRLDTAKVLQLSNTTSFVRCVIGKTDHLFRPTSVWIDTNFNVSVDQSQNYISGLQLFNKIGVIGDSISVGWAKDKNDNNSRRNTDISWVQQMARNIGCTAYNLGASGVDPVEWFQTNYEFYEYCFPQYNSVGACDLYIIGLGLNQATLGSISDINQSDYTQNGATFYGQYARIIQMINAEHPNAIVMCLTEPTTQISSYDQAIRNICALNYINAELVDLEKDYFGLFNTDEILAQHQPDNLHFTPYGYTLIANAMMIALNDYISKHTAAFKYVGVATV